MNIEQTSEQNARVEEFQRRHKIVLLTLLFTDVVDSTKLKQLHGERAAMDLMERHHALLRGILARFVDAEEIDSAGDSLFMVFAKPSDAVQFALLTQKGVRELSRGAAHPVRDRIGIHVGEVFVQERGTERRNLFGTQVDSTARIMSLGSADQILLSRFPFDNARLILRDVDLPSIGELSWLNHGYYELKGVEEPLEVCEVGEAGLAMLAHPGDSEKARRFHAADAEPVTGWRGASDQLVPGTRWKLERPLGQGGFGEVWLAYHETLKQRRVLKFCFKAERARALKREATFFRVLRQRFGDHPNIVTIHDVFFDAPPFYLVMDFVDGPSLDRWTGTQATLTETPLKQRIELVAQIADALQAAHDSGIIHRDVKASNVLIADPSGTPCAKLVDFGIGQVVNAAALAGVTKLGFSQTVLNTGSGSGTPLYQAPEILAGQPATIRSDLYSLGVVLWQIVIGDFTKPLPTDWREQIADPLLSQNIAKCVAGDSAKRYASAAELASELRDLPQRRLAAERERDRLANIERKAYRRGVIRAAGLAVGVILVIAGLAIWAFFEATDADSERNKATKAEAEVKNQFTSHLMEVAAQLDQQGDVSRALATRWQALQVNPPGSAAIFSQIYSSIATHWWPIEQALEHVAEQPKTTGGFLMPVALDASGKYLVQLNMSMKDFQNSLGKDIPSKLDAMPVGFKVHRVWDVSNGKVCPWSEGKLESLKSADVLNLADGWGLLLRDGQFFNLNFATGAESKIGPAPSGLIGLSLNREGDVAFYLATNHKAGFLNLKSGKISAIDFPVPPQKVKGFSNSSFEVAIENPDGNLILYQIDGTGSLRNFPLPALDAGEVAFGPCGGEFVVISGKDEAHRGVQYFSSEHPSEPLATRQQEIPRDGLIGCVFSAGGPRLVVWDSRTGTVNLIDALKGDSLSVDIVPAKTRPSVTLGFGGFFFVGTGEGIFLIRGDTGEKLAFWKSHNAAASLCSLRAGEELRVALLDNSGAPRLFRVTPPPFVPRISPFETQPKGPARECIAWKGGLISLQGSSAVFRNQEGAELGVAQKKVGKVFAGEDPSRVLLVGSEGDLHQAAFENGKVSVRTLFSPNASFPAIKYKDDAIAHRKRPLVALRSAQADTMEEKGLEVLNELEKAGIPRGDVVQMFSPGGGGAAALIARVQAEIEKDPQKQGPLMAAIMKAVSVLQPSSTPAGSDTVTVVDWSKPGWASIQVQGEAAGMQWDEEKPLLYVETTNGKLQSIRWENIGEILQASVVWQKQSDLQAVMGGAFSSNGQHFVLCGVSSSVNVAIGIDPASGESLFRQPVSMATLPLMPHPTESLFLCPGINEATLVDPTHPTLVSPASTNGALGITVEAEIASNQNCWMLDHRNHLFLWDWNIDSPVSGSLRLYDSGLAKLDNPRGWFFVHGSKIPGRLLGYHPDGLFYRWDVPKDGTATAFTDEETKILQSAVPAITGFEIGSMGLSPARAVSYRPLGSDKAGPLDLGALVREIFSGELEKRESASLLKAKSVPAANAHRSMFGTEPEVLSRFEAADRLWNNLPRQEHPNGSQMSEMTYEIEWQAVQLASDCRQPDFVRGLCDQLSRVAIEQPLWRDRYLRALDIYEAREPAESRSLQDRQGLARSFARLGLKEKFAKILSELMAGSGTKDDEAAQLGYDLAKAGLKDFSKTAFQAAHRKFRDSLEIFRLEGWSLLNVEETALAAEAFQRAVELVDPKKKLDADLFAGISIALWRCNRQDKAMERFKALINAEPKWADAQTVADLHWTESETNFLEAVRAATVAKYPELAAKPK